MKTKQVFAILVLIVTTGLALHTARAQFGKDVKRTDLQKHDLSIPGREVVQALVEIGPGVTAPSHRHPGEEIIYVIEGVFEYTVEGKPVTVKAGEVLFIPSGAAHSAKNIGKGNAVELATYVVEKGKPLSVLVE